MSLVTYKLVLATSSDNITDTTSSKASMATMDTISMLDSQQETLQDDPDSSHEPELQTSPARVTQRQKQLNAAWDANFIDQAKLLAEQEDAKIKIIDESQLSLRAMMSRIESDKVITTPREYQLELFERAKKENVIAVLPTGSGKTLIAVLLLQHILEKELEDRKAGRARRISFFLVEVATLVFQQGSVLRNNLSQPVACFCGEMNLDSWSKAMWKDHFDSNLVIVMTAEVLHNCLASGFITIQEINLLILDEAHHTKKKHPYARIMRDFFMTVPETDRPRVFGTTASPVDAKIDAIQAAMDLEKMLSSKIVTVKDPTHLHKWVKPPTELESRYMRLRKPYATQICSEIETDYPHVKILTELTSKSKILTAELGEWCGNRWLVMSMTGEEGEKLEYRVEKQFASHPASQTIVDKELEDVRNARKIVLAFQAEREQSRPDLCIPDLSSKVLRLKELLDDAYNNDPETRCIVFVERRASARLLLEVFKCHAHPHMRVGLLIGSRRQDHGDQKVSIRDQFHNMNRFKDGKLNLLLATSVAEEGLDIPLCNLVIRFDLYKTMIQYMQSRGRARHENSTYIHMLEQFNADHFCTLRDVQEQEIVLRKFCENQPPDRILESLDADLDKNLMKHGIGESYTEPSTGAKLLFGTVLGQLAIFAATIPRNDNVAAEPEYIVSVRGRKFVCEVLLPAGSPLRSVIGKEYPRKSLARRSAAFEACLKLRERGLLDSNLLPVYHKQLPFMRNAHVALHGKKGNAYELVVKPLFWEQQRGSVPTTLYMLRIEVQNPEDSEFPMAPMLLLTRQSMPQFPSFIIYPKPGVKLVISLISSPEAIELSAEQLSSLNAFTLRIFNDVFNKKYKDDPAQMSYWLAPSCLGKNNIGSQQDIIDWKVVDFVNTNDGIPWSIDMAPEELENRFLVDPYSGGHRYYSIRVDPSLKATDPPPKSNPKKEFMDTIVNWTSSLWKKSRSKVTYNPDQPVLLAYKIPLRRNWLDDWDDNDLAEKTLVYVCPEPLKISAIPLATITMCYTLPAVIWRIDAYLVAQEACDVLGLQISSALALEALTKDSNNTEESREQQIQLQRGMGKNYERLEFIGDAFLKMGSSISLYANNASDDEFHFHVKRMLMICNKNLFTHAIKRKLYQYIRAEGFNRRSWYPEGLILLEGKGVAMKSDITDRAPIKHPRRSHHLGDKTIADVCEALIGASLLTGKDVGSMDMAVKAVTVLVDDSNHKALCWTDYFKQYRIPSYQTADASVAQLSVAEQIADTIGYKFKYPRLLASAFTHPSWPLSWGHVPCYQRLEFLGDSLLDMVCINFLFHEHPDRDPQWLTEHKMAMVSNKFLGALCVKLKFPKFLKKNTNSLIFEIKNYVEAMEEAEAESNGAVDYWTTAIDPPKCLSDMVEAYMGAIFVDSSFNYRVIEDFFEKHIKWFFQDMSIYDTFASNHPITLLSSLLSKDFHCHEFSIRAKELPPLVQSEPPLIAAGVMIHLEVVAHDLSSSSVYGKIRASVKAIEMLKQMTLAEFRAKFKCDCKIAGKDAEQQQETQLLHADVGTAI